jgi:two-component system sensor histidine kinase KdpD
LLGSLGCERAVFLRIECALENFFTQANLILLREFALEEIAHCLDRLGSNRGEDAMQQTSVRLMVCLSSRGQGADKLLLKGSRFADRFNAPWYGVYIQTPREDVSRIDATTHRQISNTLTLVKNLGGVPMIFKGSDVANTIAAFAKEYGITHIIMGRSRRPWYRRWFGQCILDRLLYAIPDADVIVVSRE